ncbi:MULTISPECIES: transcriptional regulator [Metallosphaera]|uniref:helix-turn-helix transcriptional regulator n=1 Tax=Metallosphaera TaxID=41980 RepID=UPI001F054A09|nr:transcriptional regulator [Metallosphaera sedula]MCH1772114.1 helix-turn-helix domain-containing protein [Metallosphaera sedula]MCP6729925.1 helix-turn-helix domain-containing protein [Metallosphaera sedula]BBL46599.1 sugar-specific transcriptional regulator TrmB [Metallosphaera sedula]
MSQRVIFLLVMVLALLPVAISQVSATFYYNGTVILYFNKPEWILIPSNWTLATSQGVVEKGQYVYPINTSEIEFHVKTKGVIQISQPNITSVSVLLPLNSKITYMSPTPVSLNEEGQYVNITFSGGNVTVLYYVMDQNPFLNPYIYTTGVSSGVTAYLAYLLWRRRPSPQITPPNELDDRDMKILDAIRAGADNLNKISELSLLPRTTVYRRVKKLVTLGLVEEIRERGKVKYVIKGGAK